jgi:hypothetical protein
MVALETGTMRQIITSLGVRGSRYSGPLWIDLPEVSFGVVAAVRCRGVDGLKRAVVGVAAEQGLIG